MEPAVFRNVPLFSALGFKIKTSRRGFLGYGSQKSISVSDMEHTLNGRNPANQLSWVVYLIIHRVVYVPGGADFFPSAVAS